RLVVGIEGCVEGTEGLRVSNLEGLDDALLRHRNPLGDLRNCRRPAVLVGELLDSVGDLEEQLLQPAGHSHTPRAITEVALDLTGDRRPGEGGELHAALRVESVDGME